IQTWPTRMDLWAEWEQIYCDVENEAAAEHATEFYESHRAEMDAGAVVLWPELEDLETLFAMRAESGHTAFAREKQSEPHDPERTEFPPEYFADHIWADTFPSDLPIRTLALDPSKGRDARKGDYSAYARVGVDASGLIFVEADLARRPTPAIVAAGIAHVQDFRPHVLAVETTQYQELLAAELHRELTAAGLTTTPIAELENSVQKELRIRRLGPLLSQRRLRFLKRSPGTRLLVDQLRDFPLGGHDDGPDALEMGIRIAGHLKNGRRPKTDGLGDRLI
ncbi:MAG: hypothetical protein ACREIV_17215, partial [Planctomycetaceae bacterium]